MGFDVILENRTPFLLESFVQLDADAQEVFLLVLSASFQTAPNNSETEIAPQQLPICLADEAYGDPENSSNRIESDLAMIKPGVEILLIASAHTPDGNPAATVDVGLRAGTIRKVLTVTGDRFDNLGVITDPTPFVTMPLVWERAFGGTDETGRCDTRNPVGIGWKKARSADPNVRSVVANITYAGDYENEPRAAGFGPIGRGWQPRLGLAGTFDDDWLENQWPLTPHDFDPRHNLAAPEDQQVESLPAGSEIATINMTPEGRWTFRLPQVLAPVHLVFSDRIEQHSFSHDTVILEPDLKRVTLRARLAITLVRGKPRLKRCVLGHVSEVWLSACQKGKAYLNPKGGDGTLTHLPLWST